MRCGRVLTCVHTKQNKPLYIQIKNKKKNKHTHTHTHTHTQTPTTPNQVLVTRSGAKTIRLF